MKIKITCPHCSIKAEASGDVIGTVVSCPTCGSSIHVGRRDQTAILTPGTYQGTCVDKSGKDQVVSRLTLTIIRLENEVVHGKVQITGDLDAELEFKGTIVGSRINFVTSTDDQKLTIEWSAEIQSGCLRGNFSATDTRFWHNLFCPSTNNQRGEWQCKKERFPIIRHVKKFTKRAVGILGTGAIICALIASDNRSEKPLPYEPVTGTISSDASSSDWSQSTANSKSITTAYTPQINHSSHQYNGSTEYKPRVPVELVGAAATKTYNYMLDQKRVDVSGHIRGDTYVNPYTRTPPGGLTFDDKLEAAGWAGAVAASIMTLDWLDQKLEERKRKKQWPYSPDK
jgi:hypothetical protein